MKLLCVLPFLILFTCSKKDPLNGKWAIVESGKVNEELCIIFKKDSIKIYDGDKINYKNSIEKYINSAYETYFITHDSLYEHEIIIYYEVMKDTLLLDNRSIEGENPPIVEYRRLD